MKHEEIVHRCFRCGYCKFPTEYQDYNCPPYRQFGFDTYASGGRMWLINAWLKGEIEAGERLAHILFSCAACANCMEQCVYKFKDYLPEIFIAAKSELVQEGKVPPAFRDYFKAVSVNGNPFKAPEAERGAWAEAAGVPRFEGHDELFFTGCVGSYDEIGKKEAASVAGLLMKAGCSIGVLGPEEICDGNDARAMGEVWLFEELAKANISRFNDHGVRKVVALDPHAYNTFKREYPFLGATFQTSHYTERLAELIREGRLKPGEYRAKVTYHDPCYLGRYNQVYEAPREVLRSVSGLELIEMERNRQNSLCCGGGGGNYYTDILGVGEDSPARVRAREALETGADILAVACPLCAGMLTTALNTEDPEGRLEVLDLAEIVRRAEK